MVMSVHDVARNNKIHSIWKITIYSKCLVTEVPDITNFIIIISSSSSSSSNGSSSNGSSSGSSSSSSSSSSK